MMEARWVKLLAPSFLGKVLVGSSDEGADWAQQELVDQQDSIVTQWNIHGVDDSIFEFPSKIVKCTITDRQFGDIPTLGELIIDEDVVDVMKMDCGIDDNGDLIDLAEDTEAVSLYFPDYEAGKAAMLACVTKFGG